MRESSIESAVVRNAENRGWIAWKLNPAWVAGVPDRILLASRGRVIFVETKTEGGKVSNIQKWIHERLRRLGFRVEIPWTMDDVRDLFDSLDQEATCEKN